jgi:hypothetical protein
MVQGVCIDVAYALLCAKQIILYTFSLSGARLIVLRHQNVARCTDVGLVGLGEFRYFGCRKCTRVPAHRKTRQIHLIALHFLFRRS